MCWKFFIPISFACFVATTGWVWITERNPMAQSVMGLVMFLIFGVGLFGLFTKKVLHNLRTTKLLNVDKQIDFNLFY